MKTAEIILWVDEDRHDPIIAALEEMGVEAFMQEEESLRAYLPADRLNEDLRIRMHTWLEAHGIEARVEEYTIDSQNWNADWEKSIQPHEVGAYVIAPTWCEEVDISDNHILIRIDPKSSFGTGYHESTRLMLRLLPEYINEGDKVLDAGTGTGILAIAALKSGASQACTFDHDEWAQENAVENFVLNGVSEHITFHSGSIEAVTNDGFDLILANINPITIIDMMPTFQKKIHPGGRILLSGLLHRDKDEMLEALSAHGFSMVDERSENDWWAVAAQMQESAPQ